MSILIHTLKTDMSPVPQQVHFTFFSSFSFHLSTFLSCFSSFLFPTQKCYQPINPPMKWISSNSHRQPIFKFYFFFLNFITFFRFYLVVSPPPPSQASSNTDKKGNWKPFLFNSPWDLWWRCCGCWWRSWSWYPYGSANPPGRWPGRPPAASATSASRTSWTQRSVVCVSLRRCQ